MTITRSLFLLVAAIVRFAIALLADLAVVTSNPTAWAFGGALAYVLSCIP